MPIFFLFAVLQYSQENDKVAQTPLCVIVFTCKNDTAVFVSQKSESDWFMRGGGE